MKTTFQLADLVIEIEAQTMPEILQAKARVDELRRDVDLLLHMWPLKVVGRNDEGLETTEPSTDRDVTITHRKQDKYDYYDVALTFYPYAKISLGTHADPDDARFPFFPGGAGRYFNPWAAREDEPGTDYANLTRQMAAALVQGKRDEWGLYRFCRDWPNERFRTLAEALKEARAERRASRRNGG